jgi:hypothetical protein
VTGEDSAALPVTRTEFFSMILSLTFHLELHQSFEAEARLNKAESHTAIHSFHTRSLQILNSDCSQLEFKSHALACSQ